jgi:hypothetical protein
MCCSGTEKFAVLQKQNGSLKVFHLLLQHPVTPPLEVYILFPVSIVAVKHIDASTLDLYKIISSFASIYR